MLPIIPLEEYKRLLKTPEHQEYLADLRKQQAAAAETHQREGNFTAEDALLEYMVAQDDPVPTKPAPLTPEEYSKIANHPAYNDYLAERRKQREANAVSVHPDGSPTDEDILMDYLSGKVGD